jgi:hypothetical protein
MNIMRFGGTQNFVRLFCSLGHAFSNYDEIKTNEMHFQSTLKMHFVGLSFVIISPFVRLVTDYNTMAGTPTVLVQVAVVPLNTVTKMYGGR